jgi:hypothetical protein
VKRSIGLAVLLTAILAAPAAAQAPSDAMDDVLEQGYYLGPGTDISESGVSDVVSSARNGGSRFIVVVLSEEPPGGSTTFAGGVLDAVGSGTVFVITEDGFVGYETNEFPRDEVEAALDAADARGGDDITYLENFAGALTGDSAPDAAGDSGGGSGAGWIVLILIVVGGVGLVWFLVRRSSKASKRRAESDIASARSEIQAQLDSMANDIIELADRVRLEGSQQAKDHYEEASAVFTKAVEELERAETIAQLEALSDRLDEAAWQLDAAEAMLEGDPVPPKPEKETARCFFDPTHRGPMEEATVSTSAGDRQVLVCKADAAKLRQGQQPDPRMIDVGGQRVPAPSAPRSHGGGGFGGMDLMAILVGGMAQGLPNLGGGSRRSGGGIFGSRSSRSSTPSRKSTKSSPGRSRGGRRRGR